MPEQKKWYSLFRRFLRAAKEVVGLALLILQLLKLLLDFLN
jgi:hypothetical protein